MTSGALSVTSGWARVEWRPWVFIALVGLIVTVVNASSDLMEMRRAGLNFAWWEPVVWEVTSASVIVALAPLIGLAVQRWPPKQGQLLRTGALYFALTFPLAGVHILGMWALREAVYWFGGERYGFFDDGFALVALYEWRKDVLTFALIGGVYWVFHILAQRSAAAPALAGDERIEVRDGGAVVFLAASDITHLEAAGNYVEVHAGGKTHLVRGTLAAWEVRLAPRGFVRVHRSRLVNRAKISAMKPRSSGDIDITLTNGLSVQGSRRYRATLQEKTSA